MTSQELRIAKISRILNNSSLSKDLSNPVVQAAYSRAYSQLQKTIQTEKAFHEETEARQRMQFSVERQEEVLKENMRKHHFNVLKKQIEDRKKRKDIKEVEKLLERPKSLPRTPPEQPKFFVREGLKDQIRAKKKSIKASQQKELDYDQFLLKVAKNSLNEEIKKKNQTKNQVFEGLKQSWNDSIVLNSLKKQADRLMYFAKSSIDHSVASPKPKIKSFARSRNRTTENSPVKDLTEKFPQTEKKLKFETSKQEKQVKNDPDQEKIVKNLKFEIKNKEKQIKNDPNQEEILKKLEAIEKRSQKIQIQKSLLTHLQSIESKEKSLHQQKQLLLNYFSSKKKSLN